MVNLHKMKKQLLAGVFALAILDAHAQVVNDTVVTGASYANQVWYSLENDNQGTSPKNNWDLGFAASGFGASIIINSPVGVRLWNYPNADASGWATVDTAGLSTWEQRWNSDTSWALGAMGRYADPTNDFDMDWGIYNMTTHVVTGDSIYIIKGVDGNYRKLMIESLTSGTYTFKYADLDGSNPHTGTLAKSAYSAKNFGYYSLQTNAALDREPVSTSWDLTFCQYTGFVPSAYTVTGVLHNAGVQVAKCADLADKATFVAYGSATYKSEINTIGYNWKRFTGSVFAVQDSLVYFVKPANGDIWKVIFTGFASADGSFAFSKEKLYAAVSAVDNTTLSTTSFAVYPNPSRGGNINLIYSFGKKVANAFVLVTDMAGRVVMTDKIAVESGLQQYVLPSGTLPTGAYVVTINGDGVLVSQKLQVD